MAYKYYNGYQTSDMQFDNKSNKYLIQYINIYDITITKMIMTIVDIQFSYYMRNHRFFFKQTIINNLYSIQ